jgi:hypothetical protein
MLRINHILLLLILLASHMESQHIALWLCSLLPAPPQDHEPTISFTISLPICKPIFLSPTSYRNSPMGPPPFISFPRNYCPPWGTHFTLGHPFLYLYIFPKFIHYLLYKPLYFPLFTLVVTVGDLLSFLATLNPCHPWLEHSFSFTLTGIVYIFKMLPRSLTYPSEFVHLVPPLAQLILGLGIPLILDLVTWLRPLFVSHILLPRAVLSLPTS